jgi:hypothetical protein
MNGWIIVNKNLEKMWREKDVAQSEIISQNLTGGLVKLRETSVRIGRGSADIRPKIRII